MDKTEKLYPNNEIMQNYKSVAMFVEVARAGSFTGAAERMGVPLATVSRHVARLEAALGARLLERTTRKIRLTEVGQRYFEHCRRGVEAFESAARVIDESHEEVTGQLRLSIPPSLGETVFAPLIARFRERYPKVAVVVVVSENVLDFVDDGIDLSFRPGLLADSSLVAIKLLTYRHVLLATPTFLAEHGQPALPDELAAFPRIAFGFPQKQIVEWRLRKGDDARCVSFQPDVAFNDYAAVRGAILQGLGIGELPQLLCGELLQAGKLIEVLPDWRFPTIGLHAVHTGARNMPVAVRGFLDTCKAYFRKRP